VPLIAFTCLRSDTLSCHSHLQLCWQSKPFLSSSSSLSNRLTEDWMEGKWSSFAQSFWKLCWSSQSVECPQNYRPQAVDKAKAGLSTASTTTAVAGCRPALSGQVCGRRIGRSLGRLTRILVAQTSSQIHDDSFNLKSPSPPLSTTGPGQSATVTSRGGHGPSLPVPRVTVWQCES
jgi:hypothetical protein